MKENNQKDSIAARLATWLIKRSSIYTFMFQMSTWIEEEEKTKNITAKDEPNDTLR